MKKIISKLDSFDLRLKRVLLRADLNVPTHNGNILQDYRLQALVPTLKLIQEKGGKIILATHIGRPRTNDPLLSTKILINWFEEHGFAIDFVENLDKAYTKSFLDMTRILLLENVRFYPGEKEGSREFAKKLALLGDFYVNDAFGLLHRTDCSVTLVPQLFDSEHKTFGLLVVKEFNALDKLITQKPLALVLGGGKVHDKLPLLMNLLEKVDMILLCPALVFTFLKAQVKPYGKSLVDAQACQETVEFLAEARKKKVEIVFPVDYVIAENSVDGPLSTVQATDFPATGIGLTIGPKSVQLFIEKLKNARGIFYNSAMGFLDRPETMRETKDLLEQIGTLHAYTVIGGGDSVAAVYHFHLQRKFDYLSTGGGATLTYLSGVELPALASM